jgi:hypothetical protein
MISRKAFLAVAVLGLLGMAGKAHAGWYRVLGGPPRTQETEEEHIRRAAKQVKAPAKRFDDHVMKRIEDASRRVMPAGPRKYTPLFSRAVANGAAMHVLASNSFGSSQNVLTVAQRLGGSQGHALQGNHIDHLLKHNANLFLMKSASMFSPWAKQWRGTATASNNSARIFSFVN